MQIQEPDACARCKYELTGLTADGVCPECAYPAGYSMKSARLLRRANPHWLTTTCMGVDSIHRSLAIPVIVFVVALASVMVLSTWIVVTESLSNYPTDMFVRRTSPWTVTQIVSVLGFVVWAALANNGAWQATSRCAVPFTLPSGCRWRIRISTIVVTAAIGIGIFSLFAWGAMPSITYAAYALCHAIVLWMFSSLVQGLHRYERNTDSMSASVTARQRGERREFRAGVVVSLVMWLGELWAGGKPDGLRFTFLPIGLAVLAVVLCIFLFLLSGRVLNAMNAELAAALGSSHPTPVTPPGVVDTSSMLTVPAIAEETPGTRIRCGYDLASLTADGVCRQCSYPMASSLESRRWLHAVDPQVPEGAVRGLWTFHFATQIAFVLTMLFVPFAAWLDSIHYTYAEMWTGVPQTRLPEPVFFSVMLPALGFPVIVACLATGAWSLKARGPLCDRLNTYRIALISLSVVTSFALVAHACVAGFRSGWYSSGTLMFAHLGLVGMMVCLTKCVRVCGEGTRAWVRLPESRFDWDRCSVYLQTCLLVMTWVLSFPPGALSACASAASMVVTLAVLSGTVGRIKGAVEEEFAVTRFTPPCFVT